MNFYTAYGATFASEIVLRELITAPPTTDPDIIIRLGSVPPTLPNPILHDHEFCLTEKQFRLKIEDTASYLVTNGKEVVIEPAVNSDADEVRSFLLGSCLGVLLHQRHILPLHASAIETERGAVLFMGKSGRGKSTLLNAFLQRGYNMLTDDIAGIVLDEQGSPLILSGMPRTKLCFDVANHLNQPLEIGDRPPSQVDKLHFQPRHQFRTTPQAIWRIYWLDHPSTGQINLAPLSRYRALEVLTKNIYRPLMLVRREARRSNFRQLSALVQAVKLYQLVRPTSLDRLTALTERIEQHVQPCNP